MTHDIWKTPVHEFMSRELISERHDALVSDVRRTLDNNDISAVPVLDDRGTLCGIVSNKDLLRAALEQAQRPETHGETARDRTAADVMRAAVLTIDEHASIASAAKEMVRHAVHRLVVLCDGRPRAVVSTRDAMRAIGLARTSTPVAEVMTRVVQTIDVTTPADKAAARLEEANVRGLVVVEGTWPVGVFTHTEALRALALPPSARRVPVEEIMSYELICLQAKTPLYRVANQARELRVRRILLEEDRRICGIVAGFDLLRVMHA